MNPTTQPSLIAGVARGTIVVNLAIAVYSGRKQDKRTQGEVTASKGANSKRAASVYKALFAECKELEDISKFQSRARLAHYRLTKPWNDFGARLLPTSLLKEYKVDMNRMESEFHLLVQKFLDRYEMLVAAAAFQLGSLFDRGEYPSRTEVARKFSFDVTYEVLPTAGDFRLDLESEVQQELVDLYEKRARAQLEAAAQDSWTQVYKALSRLSERLTESTELDDEGNPVTKRLHESMITNSLELCELLKHLNITQDPALEKARVQLEAAMSGVDIKELRKSEGERILVKQKVDAILSAFDWGVDDGDTVDAPSEGGTLGLNA